MPENSTLSYKNPDSVRTLFDRVGKRLQSSEKLNRRAESRFPVKEIVQCEFSGSKKPDNLGMIVDFSRSGLRVTSCEPVPVGTVVVVKSKTFEATCEVRNCLATTETSYEIGLKINGITSYAEDGIGEGD
jgi:hypothetical protein